MCVAESGHRPPLSVCMYRSDFGLSFWLKFLLTVELSHGWAVQGCKAQFEEAQGSGSTWVRPDELWRCAFFILCRSHMTSCMYWSFSFSLSLSLSFYLVYCVTFGHAAAAGTVLRCAAPLAAPICHMVFLFLCVGAYICIYIYIYISYQHLENNSHCM